MGPGWPQGNLGGRLSHGGTAGTAAAERDRDAGARGMADVALPPTRMTTLHILGSGSRGNCFVVEADGGFLLLDAGFSARETTRRCLLYTSPSPRDS